MPAAYGAAFNQQQSNVSAITNRSPSMPRSWSIVMVLMVASALFAMVTVDLEGSSVELTTAAAPKYVYVAKPIASEHKMVHAAESATASFANQDVSRAVLKAQQTAKKEYEAMMASALQAEAKAHKAGQKATQQALAAQAKAEKLKIQQRSIRAYTDEARQVEEDNREQARMNKETDRSLDMRIMLGQ